MRFDDLSPLQYPLPADIVRLKECGDYERARRLIEARMEDPALSGALRDRLRWEARILDRLPGEYPYTLEAGLALLEDEIHGFTRAELDAAMDAGRVDWFCVDGALRLHGQFLQTLIKAWPEYEGRVLKPERLSYKRRNFTALDDVIREMRKNGGAARRWHVRHGLRILPEHARPGEEVLVHLPLPVEYDCVRRFHLIDCGPGEGYVSDPRSAQRTIAFRRMLQTDDEFFAEYSFEIHMPCHDLDPALARGGAPADEEALSELPPHIVFTPLVRSVAREIAGEERNPLRLARRVYDYLTQKPVYSYMRGYITYPNLVETLLTGLRGDCGVFALGFITLCRALGIPARWQSGLYCAPHDVGCHDWAQFYCEPWGWLPVDMSFGNAAFHAGALDRWDFYFGHMDPFRLPAARAFQAAFDPPKRQLRSDPYDNQNGEAEYADLGLLRGQYEEACRLLDWQTIPLRK